GYPLVNISEENDNYTVEALTPGISPDQIQISVTGDQLTISGEKNPLPENVKPESIHRTERSAGRFLRTITLPEEIDRDKVAASFKNGILKITLPRAEDAKPKMIHVNVD
ncbi:MAG TPA: Hsp20/alpha crystallin family protein, partial [Candidatus Sumerlaeota bacterium]|nr:Hsp20/alpha crystallin family protein [Candidatus Sumerlaeota bacterium]